MKKLILPALMIALALSAYAQEIPERKAEHPRMMKRGEGPGRDHKMALKQLNLTDAQKEKMKAEKEAHHKKMEDLKKNEDITVKEWKARREKLAKEHKANIESIFTPEQKAKLETLKKEGQARHQEMMKKRAAHMKTTLGLTDEQSAALEKSRKEMGDKMKAIREDKKMTEEQKRAAFKELAQKQKENLKTVLTEEQVKKMKEMKKQGPRRKGEPGKGPHGQKGPRGPKGERGEKTRPPPPPAQQDTL